MVGSLQFHKKIWDNANASRYPTESDDVSELFAAAMDQFFERQKMKVKAKSVIRLWIYCFSEFNHIEVMHHDTS